MPKIPTYAGGAAFQGSYSPNLRVNSEQVDAALKQNVETLEGFAQRANKLEANKARAELTKRFGEEQQRMREESTPDSGDDFVTKAQERYAEIADEYMTNASNKRSRDYMAAEFGDIQGAFVLRDQQYTYKMQSEEAGRQLGDFSNTAANAAYEGIKPVDFDKQFNETSSDLQVQYDLSETIRDQAVPAVWGSWFHGRIERAKMPGEYDAIYKDITSGEYDDKLTPKQKIQLANLTDSRKKTMVTKRKVTVQAMFDDAINIQTSAGDERAIGTEEEFDRAIASINTGDNPEEIRKYKALKEQIFDSMDYSRMGRQELMAVATEMSTDNSYLREGGRAEMSDAIRKQQYQSQIVAARLKAWDANPHGMQALMDGDDLEAIDITNDAAIASGVLERSAKRKRLQEEQGLRFPDFWYAEDKIAFRSAWAQADASQRIALVQSLQKSLSLNTVDGRRALAEAGEAATDNSVLKWGFMVSDPRVMNALMKGASNEPLLKGTKDWSKLENFARFTVLPLFHEEDPGMKEEIVQAIVTYVAGSATLTQTGEKGKININPTDFRDKFNEATTALLGSRVDLGKSTAYFPQNAQGELPDPKRAREAILYAGSQTILDATGGLYDDQGVLMDNQSFALRNANFIVRDEGVMLRIDYANGMDGLAHDANGQPLIFDIDALITEFGKSSRLPGDVFSPKNRQSATYIPGTRPY